MKKIFFITFSFLALFIVAIFVKNYPSKTFFVTRTNQKLVVYNSSEMHFPDMTMTCTVKGKSYQTGYKFLSGKGSSTLSAADFTDKKGRVLNDIDEVETVEIQGGDTLLDEYIDEEASIQ